MKNFTLGAAGVAASAILACSAATAAPLGNVGAELPVVDSSLVELVNHGGRSCQLGGRGWHYHNNRGVRIACSPRPRGNYFIWRNVGPRFGWYNSRDRRWNR